VLKHVFEAAYSQRLRVVFAVLQHSDHPASSQHLREPAFFHNQPPCVNQNAVDEQPDAVAGGLCWR
ncbi:hypothetical protein A2U01_0086764, partial [Trifolium medium]|nr:hypothetical protein [Trifolium medium]